jgi:multidrug efflux pump subunit AcrA (membrane-fusion protein)
MFKKALQAFLLFIFFSCGKKQDVIHPEYRTITQSVYASGTIRSRDQYQVFANMPGLIRRLYITEGDSIRKGQTLVVISNPTAALNTQNSKAAFNYNDTMNNRDRLEELKNDVEITRQRKENDSSLYVRQLNLWNQGIGTRIELDQKDLNAKNSVTNYQSALLRYGQLKKQVDFAARQSLTNLAIASTQENELTVKSEVNGSVFSVLKKQGEMVTAQTPIAVVGGKDSLYLELQIDEYDIAQVKIGQQVLISMDSYKGDVFEATVSKIYPLMNERSRTFTAEALLTKRPEKLYPNLTAEANIVITSKQKALLVPRAYVIDDQYVWLKNKKKVPVKTGLKDNKYVEIVSGISTGDELINPAK